MRIARKRMQATRNFNQRSTAHWKSTKRARSEPVVEVKGRQLELLDREGLVLQAVAHAEQVRGDHASVNGDGDLEAFVAHAQARNNLRVRTGREVSAK